MGRGCDGCDQNQAHEQSSKSREHSLAVETVIGQLLSTPRDVLERQDPKSLENDGLASWTEPADRLVCYALFGLESKSQILLSVYFT